MGTFVWMARRIALVVALCTASAFAASRLRIATERPYDVPLLPRPTLLRVLSLGHPISAANVYWLKTVQYIGEPRANERGWDKLFPLIDLVTELDPDHGYAYQVGGILLGSVGRVEESNAILEKGMRAVPGRYILPFLRAFNAFYYDGDFVSAGRYVEIAAQVPNAPQHLKQTAMAFYVKGGQADAAIGFLSRLRTEAHDVETARALDEQLKQAYLEKYAAVIDDALRRYREAFGISPPTLEILISAGYLRELPSDPFGGRFVIGDDGRVRSSVNPFRYKRSEDLERGHEPGVTPGGYSGATVR